MRRMCYTKKLICRHVAISLYHNVAQMLPSEIFKLIAKEVKTLKCYCTLSLLCKNAAIGCKMYADSIRHLAKINVQIAYNFSGHHSAPYWHHEHVPMQLSYQQIIDATGRIHVGCDTIQKDMRCSCSRYYMSLSYGDGISTWEGHQNWNMRK